MNQSGVVTIARRIGSGGSEVSARVAEELGFELLDDRLREMVLARKPEVDRRILWDEALPSLWLRTLSIAAFGMAGVPTTHDDRALGDAAAPIHSLKRIIREAAGRGRVVIVGRGAAHELGPRADCLHVLLVTPEAERVAAIAAVVGLSTIDALRRVQKADRAQADYIKGVYGHALDDRRSFDLVVECVPTRTQPAVETIVTACRARFGAGVAT